MATQTIEFVFLAGETPTVNLFDDDGTNGAALATPTATERSNRPGVYSFTQTDRAAGDYLITIEGNSINAVAYVTLEATEATYYATSERAVTSGGGGGQTTSFSNTAYNQIVAAVVQGLPDGPTLNATINAAGGNSYCAVSDVEARLSAFGVTAAADVDDPNGTRDTSEEDLIADAIEYANQIIDEHVIDLLHPANRGSINVFTRPAGNMWLRGRAIDIASYRLLTLGGRNPPDVIARDYADAMDRLEKARDGKVRIPHLDMSNPTRPYAVVQGSAPTIVRG
jgi:hypothetical protein